MCDLGGRWRNRKRGYHTLKSQLVAAQNTEEIICVFCGKGRGHDFSLFKKSRVRFHPLTTSIEDSGYQGIAAYHSSIFLHTNSEKSSKCRLEPTQTPTTSKKLCRRHGPIWPKLERHGVSSATCRDMSATFPAKMLGEIEEWGADHQ